MPASEDDIRVRIDNAARSAGQDDEALADVLAWILEASHSSQHWFCDQADDLHRDASTFLLRLVCYKDKDDVKRFKEALHRQLNECCGCAEAYHDAKERTVDQWIRGHFQADQVDSFSAAMDRKSLEWSLTGVAECSARPWQDWPAQLIHFILSGRHLYTSDDVLSRLASSCGTEPLARLPRVPSAGLFALALHKDPTLRDFAQAQLAKCRPVTLDQWTRRDRKWFVLRAFATLVSDESNKDPTVTFTRDRAAFWQGLAAIVNRLSSDVLLAQRQDRKGKARADDVAQDDILRTICSRLDTRQSDQLRHIISAFESMLRHCDRDMWADNDLQYAEVVLHTLLDNPALEEIWLSGDDTAAFSWLHPFLRSVSSRESIATVTLGAIAKKLCGDFQSSRFKPQPRARAASIIVSAFSSIFTPAATDSASSIAWPQVNASRKIVLDVYAAFLVQLAYGKQDDDAIVQRAVVQARIFVQAAVKREAVLLSAAIPPCTQFVFRSESSRKVKIEAPQPISYAKSLWHELYSIAQAESSPAVTATLVKAIEPIACFTPITRAVWRTDAASARFDSIRPTVDSINKFLDTARAGMIEVLMTLSEESHASLGQFLREKGVMSGLIALLFSPNDQLHRAALAVVRAYADVIDRADCFRSLLALLPEEALKALNRVVRTFCTNAKPETLPETVDSAKQLVRNLTDVLEVLCDAESGFLRRADWMKSDTMRSLIANLWQSMCQALGLIFERTPSWAPFHSNSVMVEWMRDAVTFGNALLEDIRSFEAAVIGRPDANRMGSPQKTTAVGEQMIDSLGLIFEPIFKWLRLNDDGMLALAADLIRKMIDRFVRSGRPVDPNVIRSLIKFGSAPEKIKLPAQEILGFLAAMAKHKDHKETFTKILSAKGTVEVPNKRSKLAVEVVDVDDLPDVIEVPKSAKPVKDVKPSMFKNEPKPSTSKPTNGKIASPFEQAKGVASGKTTPLPPRTIGPRFGQPSMAAKPRMVYKHDKSYRNQLGDESDDDEESSAPAKTGLSGLVQRAADSRSATPPIAAPNLPSTRKTQVLDGLEGRATGRLKRALDRQRGDVHLRLAIDYSDLHRQILQWSIDSNTDQPPFTPQPRKIPASFRTADEYQQVFEPLLLCEAWAHIMRAKEEVERGDKQPIACQLSGRQGVDDFEELSTVIQAGKLTDRSQFTDSDLVLLRQGERKCLAKIKSITRKQDRVEIWLRVHLETDRTRLRNVLLPGSTWEIIHMLSLSTLHREYAALKTLPYYALVDHILDPERPPLASPDDSDIKDAMRTYRVNQPQALAILGALSTDGFSLIQGPPGTGKTSTILGLLGAFFGKRTAKRHVLLCAPSNAAVDEIVRRLKQGILGPTGKWRPDVVRIGVESKIADDVKDVSLDAKVDLAMGGAVQRDTDSFKILNSLRAEIELLKQQRTDKRAERDSIAHNAEARARIDVELREISKKLNDKGDQLTNTRDKASETRRSADLARRSQRVRVLEDADIICATLSGAGQETLSQLTFEFNTVIVDEAAQSVELASLIPLRYGCTRCIFVGDPNQLPPTVLSRPAINADYNQSMFVRMQRAAQGNVHILSIQYRMHPSISKFPSLRFYQSRLQDGPDMAGKTKQAWHADGRFPPYAFLHVIGGKEERGRYHSLLNKGEAAMALSLYKALRARDTSTNLDSRVAIIATYRAQLFELKRVFQNEYGPDITTRIDFNTVDGVQGQEKDIVILSCVRGSGDDVKGTIGFLSDVRRMNVALTRARSSLWILGNAPALERNESWKALIDDARERSAFREVDRSTFAAKAALPAYESPPAKPRPRTSNPVVPIPPPDLVKPSEMIKKPVQPPQRTAMPPTPTAGPSRPMPTVKVVTRPVQKRSLADAARALGAAPPPTKKPKHDTKPDA